LLLLLFLLVISTLSTTILWGCVVLGTTLWSLLLLLLLSWSTSCLLGFLVLGFLDLGKLFELGFGWLSRIHVWERYEETQALNLLSHAWEVLDVIQPSEAVGELDLLEVHQLSEMLSDVQLYDDISCGDALANQKHLHGEVLVNMGDKVVNLCPLGQLDEAENLQTILAVLFAEEDLLKVSGSGQLHHDGDDV
jgi:hypothetical protein